MLRRACPARNPTVSAQSKSTAASGAPAEPVLRAHKETLEAIASVARSFAHMLNNLLAVSKGNLALLNFADDQAGAESRAILADVMAALGRAQRLSGHLAAVSHWREFRARTVSPQAFFSARAEGFSNLLGPGHALEFAVEDGLSELHTDPAYLELAVNALLLNASQAMDGCGPVRIECCRGDVPDPSGPPGRARRAAPPARMLRLSVEDRGRRTAVDAASRLFRAGFAADAVPGPGIGLWLVRQFALAAGGDVFAEKSARRRNRIGMMLPTR
jgi:signal transduction histidine kinase